MAYQSTHPVEVGTYGHFKYGGTKLVETWIALEDICFEMFWQIGIYCTWDLLELGKERGLLTPEEFAMFEAAL